MKKIQYNGKTYEIVRKFSKMIGGTEIQLKDENGKLIWVKASNVEEPREDEENES